MKRHDLLYTKGDLGKYFYIIINGSVEVFYSTSNDTNRSEVVVDIMRKGDTLGIVSILEKKPHSFSARALGFVRMLVLNETDLNYVMQKVSSFNIIITRILSKRLRIAQGDNERKVVESSIISVFSPDNEDIGSKYAVQLAENIMNESKKAVVVIRVCKTNTTPIKASSKIKNISYDDINSALQTIDKYIYSYNIIIIDLPINKKELCDKIFSESDYCHYLTYSDNITESEFIKKYSLKPDKLKSNFFKYIKLSRSKGQTEINDLAKKNSREVAEVRVGLALGGGAAFGLAQIGVLKLLEKEKIKIDMVSGTSIGSLVGAIWCAGVSAFEIEKTTNEINSMYNLMKLVDFSIMPRKGLISGNNIRKFLERFLGKKTFDDLNIALRVIACNINSREEVVLQSGNVVDAVMASTAIPGLFNPIKTMNNMVLVDGGIVNPLPVSPLTIEGINRVIAVNAMPSPDDVVRSNSFDQSIMDIFINSFYSLQYRLCKYSAQSSDVYISPILPNSAWFEFFRAKEFIDFGEKIGYEKIRLIKKLVRK
ncbi:MAG: hypothetical protein EBS19_03970 [Spirochaetia bacterium]|nr:hypothetical protein [Spirochaetia bacterium]